MGWSSVNGRIDERLGCAQGQESGSFTVLLPWCVLDPCPNIEDTSPDMRSWRHIDISIELWAVLISALVLLQYFHTRKCMGLASDLSNTRYNYRSRGMLERLQALFGFGWFFEWPGGQHPLNSTWPWADVKPSIVVLWGVCWMFAMASGASISFAPRALYQYQCQLDCQFGEQTSAGTHSTLRHEMAVPVIKRENDSPRHRTPVRYDYTNTATTLSPRPFVRSSQAPSNRPGPYRHQRQADTLWDSWSGPRSGSGSGSTPGESSRVFRGGVGSPLPLSSPPVTMPWPGARDDCYLGVRASTNVRACPDTRETNGRAKAAAITTTTTRIPASGHDLEFNFDYDDFNSAFEVHVANSNPNSYPNPNSRGRRLKPPARAPGEFQPQATFLGAGGSGPPARSSNRNNHDVDLHRFVRPRHSTTTTSTREQPYLRCAAASHSHSHSYLDASYTNTNTNTHCLSDPGTMSLSYESRTFPDYPQSAMMHDPHQEQDDSSMQHHRYPSPPPPMTDNTYISQDMDATDALTLEDLPELPSKEESDAPSPGRSKPIPKPDREVTKGDDGRFICTWVGCAEDVRTFSRKCEWSKHMDKHDRPYKCPSEGCEKLPGFTYSGGLLRHQREVHNLHGGPRKQLNCPHPNCKRFSGKGFSRQENLNEHLRRVHTDAAEVINAAEETEDEGSEVAGMKRKRPQYDGVDVRMEMKRLRKENEELKRQAELQTSQTNELMRQLQNLQNLVGSRIQQVAQATMM